MSQSPDPGSSGSEGRESTARPPLSFDAQILALLPQLRRYSRSLTRSDVESEDLLQDCVEKALTHRAQWRGANIRSWAYRIMTNLHLNARRSVARRPSVSIEEAETVAVNTAPADPLERNRLVQALDILPAETRAVLMLVAVEGHSYQEVADLLDIPIGTVMSRLSRARQMLRRKLQEENVIHLRSPPMSESRPVSETELHAYADGLLDEAGRLRVESHLAIDRDAARMVADWQAQNDGLRNAFAGYAISRPSDFQFIAKHSVAIERAGPRRLAMAAAAALVFVLGGLAGHFGPTFVGKEPVSTAMDALPHEARNAYLIYASEVRHPVEVFADEEAHLATWLGKRLSIADLKVPNLQTIGFRLVGGRLLPVADKPGAMFMYENGAGSRITVLVGRNEGNRTTSFRFASADDVETFYWIDGDLGYAVTGDISRDLLQQIAEECYRQFPT